MLVDELNIPQASGAIRIPLDERVTVFAGLDAPARARLVRLLVSGLAGDGPATVHVRDDQGRPGRIGPGSALEDEPDAADVLARLIVVSQHDLGLDGAPPDPSLAGERTATAIAHRQLIREVHALDAGAAERTRVLDELGHAPAAPRPSPAPASDDDGPDLDAVAGCATLIDDLMRRRRAADDALHAAHAALRASEEDASDPWRPADGDLRTGGHLLGTGLLTAVEVLRRIDAAGSGTDPAGDDVVADAHLAADRARDDLLTGRDAATAEVAACDRDLAIIAAAANVPVTVMGPGAALTAALAERRRTRTWSDAEANDPAARLLARRRAALNARVSELPEHDEVDTARRQLSEVASRLQSLGRTRSHEITDIRQVLIGRAAALRHDGVSSIAPLVLDDALTGLPDDAMADILDLVLRIAERAQVVILSSDPALAEWARPRAEDGEIRLVEIGCNPSR